MWDGEGYDFFWYWYILKKKLKVFVLCILNFCGCMKIDRESL